MQEFSPNRVWLQYRDCVMDCSPVYGRTYTMTHSDETADLFVVVGMEIAQDRIDELRDEVILRWEKYRGRVILYGEVLVELNRDRKKAEFRNQIFTKEMPLALAAIYQADRSFFIENPELVNTPVYIHFKSCFSEFNRVQKYGSIGEYDYYK